VTSATPAGVPATHTCRNHRRGPARRYGGIGNPTEVDVEQVAQPVLLGRAQVMGGDTDWEVPEPHQVEVLGGQPDLALGVFLDGTETPVQLGAEFASPHLDEREREIAVDDTGPVGADDVYGRNGRSNGQGPLVVIEGTYQLAAEVLGAREGPKWMGPEERGAGRVGSEEAWRRGRGHSGADLVPGRTRHASGGLDNQHRTRSAVGHLVGHTAQ
jgi:hypothetical protein